MANRRFRFVMVDSASSGPKEERSFLVDAADGSHNTAWVALRDSGKINGWFFDRLYEVWSERASGRPPYEELIDLPNPF